MAMTETKALRYQCDAEPCNVVHIVDEGTEPAGLIMTVRATTVEDDMVVITDLDVYACKRPHIRPAFERVLAEADELVAAHPSGETAPAGDVEGDDPADEAEPALTSANGVATR